MKKNVFVYEKNMNFYDSEDRVLPGPSGPEIINVIINSNIKKKT